MRTFEEKKTAFFRMKSAVFSRIEKALDRKRLSVRRLDELTLALTRFQRMERLFAEPSDAVVVVNVPIPRPNGADKC